MSEDDDAYDELGYSETDEPVPDESEAGDAESAEPEPEETSTADPEPDVAPASDSVADDADHEEDADASHDDHGHGADWPDYDPTNPDLPAREPPLRSTAPQSDFTMGQVKLGVAVLAVGLLLTFGVAFLAA